MFDYNRGAKAGGIAGMIIGIINVLISSVFLIYFADALSITSTDLGSSVFIFVIMAVIMSGILGGIIAGGIMGIIFSAVISKLPGSTSVAKGLVFAFVYWLILGVGLGYTSISQYGQVYYVVFNVIIGFCTSMFWGFLTGKLWDRYGGGKEQPLI
jgi:hypothetical protein